jgi:hypothetical protein
VSTVPDAMNVASNVEPLPSTLSVQLAPGSVNVFPTVILIGVEPESVTIGSVVSGVAIILTVRVMLPVLLLLST